MTKLDKYIEDQGGILSGQLAEYIEKSQKITNTAARKRVERLVSPIHKLSGLFADNQSFIYHSNCFNGPEYFEKLELAIETSSKRCYSIITSINYHYGLIPKNELANYTFCPTLKIKGHQLYTTIIERLISANVLIDFDDDHYSINPFFPSYIEPNFRHFKAIQFAKSLVVNQFVNWSKNIGLVSYNSSEKNNVVAGFQFSFTAPTYISGLIRYKESHPMPGFVVADVLTGNTTTNKEIDFFIQKISIIQASNPSIRLIPVLIVDSVSVDALASLKKSGVLVAIIREIFGEDYNDLLKELINTVNNAGAILVKNPEKYIELMKQLTKLVDGKTNNLRGDLFELAVGYYYGKQCQTLDIGKKIKIERDAKTREIDVLACFENEVRIVECKGYNYPIDDEYVQIYLSDRIPTIRKWLDLMYPNKKHVFEIWSTGGFTDTSTLMLKKASESVRRYQIDYLNKSDILERAKKLGSSKFVDILKEYYFKDDF